MNSNWPPESDWPGFLGPDSEPSGQLQPPLWGLPASGNGSYQSPSLFPGDINIRPTVAPESRLAASEILPAHTATAYDNFNPNLQDRAGGSNPSLQSGVQSPTGSWLHQALSRSLHHGSSDADQNTQQVALAPSQSLLNPASFEPAQTQAAQTQSSLSGLGANVPNDQDHRLTDPEPDSMFERLSQTRNVKQKVARACPYKTPVSSKPLIPSSIIDDIKRDASSNMKTTLFNQSLFPSTQDVVEWAKSALSDAAAVHIDNSMISFILISVSRLISETEDELATWRLMREGQNALSQLKGSVKKLHTNSREYAKGFLAGAYGLSLDVFQDSNNVIPSRQAHASFLVSNNNFLDTFVQVST